MSTLSEIPVQEFLGKVEARGVRLRIDGENIRIGWPVKTPDPEIRQTIIDRKPEILEALISVIELEYYQNLLEIMQSPKFGLDRVTAEREAKIIVDEYRLRKKSKNNENYKQ